MRVSHPHPQFSSSISSGREPLEISGIFLQAGCPLCHLTAVKALRSQRTEPQPGKITCLSHPVMIHHWTARTVAPFMQDLRCTDSTVTFSLTDCARPNACVTVCSLPHAVNCRSSVFGAVTFCLCMKYLGNCWADLHQIHTEDVFEPSLRRVWRSRSKVKGQGHQGPKTDIFWPFGGGLCLVKHL